MPYETIDDITRADVAFRITGKDLNELFFSGAEALMSVMLEYPESISRNAEKKIILKNVSLDMLLYDFLSELIFIKDAESLLLLPENIKIENMHNNYILNSEFYGEKIDRHKHKLIVDVKAVTMHNLRFEKLQTGWESVFVLDL
jgi:SHS2 domain-containing protein